MKESYIRKLIKILENSKIDSLYITSFWGMKSIKLTKNLNDRIIKNEAIENDIINVPVSDNIINTKSNEATIEKNEDVKIDNSIHPPLEAQNIHTITAPLVGTFYLSSKPGEQPFINIGDKISTGQTVCIIEAMKIFNEIESEVSGTIIEILVDDSTPIEYGQDLFLLKLDD